MDDTLLIYDLGEGAEAFSSRRDSALPYHVIQGHQVHDTRIAVIDSPALTREDLEGYDAFVTSLEGVAIGVRTADCVPILLYDPAKRIVAAVHSGWKGTVKRISQKTISFMKEKFGCVSSDLRAAIGPAIMKSSFQVGEEVVAKFREESFPMDRILSWEGEGDGTPMSGGYHIDLVEANMWLLEESGIPDSRIQTACIDTFTDTSFFSARREGISCGRIINSIRLVPSKEQALS
ncbi:MAG: laccase domain-containing protein [Bacteroidales bacterium]|nr:laccase domain-containing protein [Bacteroidales bacterium]